MNDSYDLKRYIDAQQTVYETVINELRHAHKQTHWMWYIFPQFDGLASSSTSRYYAIKSLQEASAYLKHSVLGERLIQCTQLVLDSGHDDIADIFPYPDNLKFYSCMTLFAFVTDDASIFHQALNKFFNSEPDLNTLSLVS